MLLITPESNSRLNDFGGQKAQNLVKLTKLGSKVPKFATIAIPFNKDQSNARKWLENNTAELKTEIKNYFGNCHFAVRSNTQIEDGFESSKAGYFKTVLDVELDDIEKAILEVYQDCFTKFNSVDLKKISEHYSNISIIIQQFIKPQFAGVVFSRDPNGSGALTLDYTAGTGDKLVSGQTFTNTVKAYTFDDFKAKIKIKSLVPLFEIARKLENDFKYSQDIEWCVDSKQLYILQTRPITSLNTSQIETYPILDSIVAKQAKFHFYKPELAEVTPKPKALILNIIRKLYQNNGPIAQTYAGLGIKYNYSNFIKILGSDLFFDQILEKKAFFNLKEPFSSFKNIFRFTFLKAPKPQIQFQLLADAIIKNQSKQDLNQSIKELLNIYPLIFSTNIYAAKEHQNLAQLTSKTPANKYLEFANSEFDFSSVLDCISKQNWLGNSLNIEDETKFETFLPRIKSTNDHNLDKALKNEPNWKVQHLKKAIESAKNWLELRELSRVLTVKYINHIRQSLNDQITLGLPHFT